MDAREIAPPVVVRATAKPDAPAEPATARALWPTFLRRTLEEDALRQEAQAQRKRGH
jgi:hypothetical protein